MASCTRITANNTLPVQSSDSGDQGVFALAGGADVTRAAGQTVVNSTGEAGAHVEAEHGFTKESCLVSSPSS